MEYLQATSQQTSQIYELVQDTIKTIYPRYYPAEVVGFFCEHHSYARVAADIEKGVVGIAVEDNCLLGTGSYEDDHITRVYVAPSCQGRGVGSFIMDQLEQKIAGTYANAMLDASLPASRLYEHRGYRTIHHDQHLLAHDVVLVYEIMAKPLQRIGVMSYEGKQFVPKYNTANGEVDAQTIFSYHQEGELIWASYQGGEIVKGFLVGTAASDHSLDFHYQHLNDQHQLHIGNCHSVPKQLADGRLELHEEWQWLNEDQSKGSSILIEKQDR